MIGGRVTGVDIDARRGGVHNPSWFDLYFDVGDVIDHAADLVG
jgi:hypothetical protein